jgi:hypothetical protein
LNIDWSATGQMLAGWGSWAQALGIFLAAYFAKQAADSWRSQRVAETRMDVANSYLENLLPLVEDTTRIYENFKYHLNFEFQQTTSLADYIEDADVYHVEQASNHHFEVLHKQSVSLKSNLRELDFYNPKLLILFQLRPHETPHQMIEAIFAKLIDALDWFSDPNRDYSRRDEAFHQLRSIDSEGDLALIRKQSEDQFIIEARGQAQGFKGGAY